MTLSRLRAWGRSEYNFACFCFCQDIFVIFIPCSFIPRHFPHIFFHYQEIRAMNNGSDFCLSYGESCFAVDLPGNMSVREVHRSIFPLNYSTFSDVP